MGSRWTVQIRRISGGSVYEGILYTGGVGVRGVPEGNIRKPAQWQWLLGDKGKEQKQDSGESDHVRGTVTLS